MTIKLPTKPSPEFACLGCGGTRELFNRAGVDRMVGVQVPGYDELLPICSACEGDLGKMIEILAARVEPAASPRRRREVEVVLWRVHNAAVARLKADIGTANLAGRVLELERYEREMRKDVRHLEERPLPPRSLFALVVSDVRGWLERLVRRLGR